MDCQNCEHRLAGKSLFSCLGCSALEVIEEHRHEKTYSRGQVLFHQGDPLFGIYCVKRGLVKLEAYSSQGEVHLLRLARPGEPLGYRAYISRLPYRCQATALTDVQVCAIPTGVLQDTSKRSPEFSEGLVQRLASDLQCAEDRWLGLMQKNSEQRVAQILLEFHGAGQEFPARKDMAHLVDMAPETFTRVLSGFEGRGWLSRTRKTIELLQLAELQKLAGS